MSQKFALIETLEDLLPLAFAEDLPDITSEAICPLGNTIVGRINAKQPGVICGLPFLPYIFSYRMSNVSVAPQVKPAPKAHRHTKSPSLRRPSSLASQMQMGIVAPVVFPYL